MDFEYEENDTPTDETWEDDSYVSEDEDVEDDEEMEDAEEITESDSTYQPVVLNFAQFMEFNRLAESAPTGTRYVLNEGVISDLKDKVMLGINKLFGGGAKKIDKIFGNVKNIDPKTGKFKNIKKVDGEYAKITKDWVIEGVKIDEDIAKEKTRLKNSNNDEVEKALAEFIKRKEKQREASEKKYKVAQENINRKVAQILSKEKSDRVKVYARARKTILDLAIVNMEYDLRKKFSDDGELDKYAKMLVKAKKDAREASAELDKEVKKIEKETPQKD